jgi:hypothetical protein
MNPDIPLAPFKWGMDFGMPWIHQQKEKRNFDRYMNMEKLSDHF